MKKYIKFGLLSLCFLTAIVSCKDTLDTHPTTTFDETTVWGSKATAQAFINATYASALTSGWAGSGSCISWESRTPNSVRCSQVGEEGIDGIATELGLSNGTDFGINRFGLLRRCNLILEKVAESEKLSDGEKVELSAHAYFMRGIVFFDQARKMGRFVPIKEVLSQDDTLKCKIPLTKNVAESYTHVIEDLTKAAEGLPETASPGIPTKYAAKVFLSRAALQAYAYTKEAKYLDLVISAAQDVVDAKGGDLTSNYGGMFNETASTDPEIILGYYRLKTNSNISNFDELIRCYPNINADDAKISLSPINFLNKNGKTFDGWAIFFPTQDLVDQYLVLDEKTGEALPWYETSQYLDNVEILDASTIKEAGQVDSYERTNGELRRIPTPQDLLQVNDGYPNFTRYAKLKSGVTRTMSSIMYDGRDKRFAASIIYDGCSWIGEQIETNLGGNLSAGVRDKEDGGWYNTTTGYYWRKNTRENPNPRCFYSVNTDYHYVLARVGEAYLNLAEAYLLKDNVAKAVENLNATRTKHGGLAPSKATNIADAWKDYIRERRVEMTNEGGDIYFSYLRWGKYGGHANYGKPAGDIIVDLDKPAHKIAISRDRSKILVGQMTLLNSAQRKFTTKRYLFPIPIGFLNTREAYGLDFEQNPEW